MNLTVREVVLGCGAELLQGNADTVVESFSNDSRAAKPGCCFVAIRAERDGHAYVGAASRAGAVAAIVDRNVDVTELGGLCLIQVDSTVPALAAVARAVRSTALQSAVCVGITGSTGKTSTKDLCVGALRSMQVHANQQSFNNEIGLPLTILDAAVDCEVLVLEMGARFAGNIHELCEIAQPSIGVITNIGLAHAEHLGGVDGIVATKGELLAALPSDGLAVIDAGLHVRALKARTLADTLIVGGDAREHPDVLVQVLSIDENLRPTISVATPWGTAEMLVGLRGAHQAVNAAMALTVALRCGVDLTTAAAGIAAASGSSWRMDVEHLANGVTLINDAYNANPTSMRAALDALVAAPCVGRRIAVLGGMRELGSTSHNEHVNVASTVAQLGIEAVVCVGTEGRWIAEALRTGIDSENANSLATVDHVDNAEDASAIVEQLVRSGDVVLVKASRAVGLEVVAQRLIAASRGGEE